MARYCGAVCRLCRREGEKLFLKGERCFTAKCAIERRPVAPGQHGRARQSHTDYKVRLREKQKAKRMYGVMEAQFRRYYEMASQTDGVTGTNLLASLETRLDSIVFRLGFGSSRSESRQLVLHKHVLVNGKRVNTPSYKVKVGDTVEIREKSKKSVSVQSALAQSVSRIVPEWLSIDKDAVRGTIKAIPTREQMAQNINEQLIVELYSR